MIVHTWLVFFPLLQKHDLYIYLSWWRPIDPTTGFYVENCHHHRVNVSINDIYALIISTIIFLILFPLSMHKKFRKKHWTLSQYIHITAATLYGIELLRTPFTAHCWFISTPFISFYIIDRLFGMFYYRTSNNAKIVCQYNVDDQYILLFMNIPNIYSDNNYKNGTYRQIGDVFWINTKKYGYYRLRPSHPFTTFYNHQCVLSNRKISKSIRRRNLGDKKHKFSLRVHKSQKSVSHTQLQPDESYELHRNDTRSELDTTITTITTFMDKPRARMLSNDSIKLQHVLTDDERTPVAGLEISSFPQHNENDNKSSFWSRTLNSLRFINPRDADNSDDDEDDSNDEYKGHKRETSIISTTQNWNVGFLMAVHPRKDKFGFTQNIKKSAGTHQDMLCYGPYRSSFANIIDEMENDDIDEDGSIVLIGTGAGAAYIIDFMMYLRAKLKHSDDFIVKRELRIHFSCRSVKLFQWITDFLCEESIENVEICAHLTSHKNVYDYDESQNLNKRRRAKIGRAAFDVFLKQSPPNSKVFFCGSPFIQSKLSVMCQQLNFTFFEGHSFG